MNERILELAFKLFDEDDQSEPGAYIQLNVEKFAELIVRECVKLLVTGKGNDKTSDAIWDLEKLGVDVGKLLDEIEAEDV